eukprot:scaffold8206_cov64-Phaeocystis_antarctica.AAC.4
MGLGARGGAAMCAAPSCSIAHSGKDFISRSERVYLSRMLLTRNSFMSRVSTAHRSGLLR